MVSQKSRPLPQFTVPYVTAWSAESIVCPKLVTHPLGGVAYPDETLTDRDSRGNLWARTAYCPGQGKPDYGIVHPMRQRRAMRQLLCQVCGGPADRTEAGVLWLLQDHRQDWVGWPEAMAVTEPPICRACVPLSLKLCPALRKGAVTVRAQGYPLVGFHGQLHTGADLFPRAVGKAITTFESPTARWILATGLVRELRSCLVTALEAR
ncbi:hypothetical protein ALI144C_12180 [Actinosynnema sp. ALI-1.44]|nr:hypothetical protein ALI144C_12180 [Actinosynnema sp. ALI-1.44]